MASAQQPAQVPPRVVAGLKAFTSAHHGATAAIEHVGRRGARIVLVGEDGAWGDQLAPATDIARAACEEAGVPVENGWARELADSVSGDTELWSPLAPATR